MHNNNTSAVVGEQKEAVTWHPNRAYIQLSTSIVIDSCFPGGNIATAALTSLAPLTVELEGNTDISMDLNAKYWLYFRIRGFRRDRPIKFVLRNTNHLRKYVGQTRIRPYMVYREQGEQTWQPLSSPIDLYFAENGQLQGSFTFQSDKYLRDRKPNLSTNDLHRGEKLASTAVTQDAKRGSCYFAMFYPYGYDDLMRFIEGMRREGEGSGYFNEETIVYSFERRKVHLLTITSPRNIESYSEREPCPSQEIFPNPKDRPFRLKNCPVIFLTARVHPSETSSSFFIEGLVSFLMSDIKPATLLRELFIFQIIPMLNPDGVQHGNFRFDHELRNLNRYYGQASIEKTPAIRAAQIMLNFYKYPQQQSRFTQFYEECYPRLLLYADVHGHCSALPSFIYGNHTDRLEHAIQNKVFCKILEQNFLTNGFSKVQSQFSKKNMTSQQKYDEFSKLCSGRVFAGRAESLQQQVFHSYTIEVLPYWEQFSRRRSDQKGEKVNAMDYARLLGKAFAVSLLDLLDINPESRLSQAEMQKIRRQIEKECLNEQSRKLLNFKRAESCNEAPHSDSKSKIASDKAPHCLKEYITRWFSNEAYLRHLAARQELIREPKILKFLQLTQNNKFIQAEITQSPRKVQPRHCNSKAITEPREGREAAGLKDRMIFVCRKERGKVESRINKQTLELQHDFLDLLPHSRPTPNQQMQMDFATYKKESLPKRDTTSTDRYEHQLLTTIAQQEHRRLAFDVRVKEILPKANSRTQTETVTSEPVLIQCPSSIPHSISKKEREYSTPARQHPRPSFIEEFMLKIREERESANVFLQKYEIFEEGRTGKARSSIRDQLQDQERKLLPILRRNKIFTMVSQEKQEGVGIAGRAFETIGGKRREGLDEAVLKTKKILIAQKKEEIIRDQLLKKSHKMSQYKS